MQNRRTLLTAAGTGAMVSLLSSRAIAQATNNTAPPATNTRTVPADPFILLLRGIYVPVTNGPDLGLSGVNLADGTYSRTRIYAVFGVPDADNEDERESNKVPTKPIGNFYVQSNAPAPGSLCAYDLPNGAIAMQFDSGGFTPHPDGMGGTYRGDVRTDDQGCNRHLSGFQRWPQSYGGQVASTGQQQAR
jgi:hypothetical protein